MDITIRQATMDDASAIAALAGELGYPANTVEMRERLRKLTEGARNVVFVACSNQVTVGWIEIAITDHLAAETRTEINGLVVTSSARSQGIGRRLVAHAEDWSRSQGLRQILVRSRSTRDAAHRFYLREGYSENKRQVVFVKSL